jgi:hypothetical protein
VPRIVIEVPSEFKGLAAAFQELVDSVWRTRASVERGGRACDYGEVERRIGSLAAGLERASHEAMLGALDVNVPRVSIEGKPYRQVERCAGTYRTLAGEVSVERSLYREEGVRNARVVDAISLRTGAIGDGWLPETANAVAHLLQQGTSRDAAQTCSRLGRLPYSRSSIERVGHMVGELLVQSEVAVAEAVSEQLELAEGSHSIGVQVDRVSVPMEEPLARPRGRPKKRAPKRPIERVFRMAYCGTVTVHDDKGEVLSTLRHAAMPEHGPQAILEAMLADVLSLRVQAPLPVVLLADGASEMWGLLDGQFHDQVLGVEPHRLVDFWHLIEKLAPAARLLSPSEEDGAALLARWRARLLNSDAAADRILGELHRSGLDDMFVGTNRPVHDAITYLTNHPGMTHYATARQLGLPIGSGPVEACCKTLVEVRMKRAGSRWKTQSGAHILKLRAIALSDRWDAAMKLVFKPLRKAVRHAA